MSTATLRTWQILKGITPVIFFALCTKTGTLLISIGISIFRHPTAASNLYMGLDLSALMAYDRMHYGIIAALLLLVTGLKAWMAFDAWRIFSTLDMELPFSPAIHRLIRRIGVVALATGVLAVIAEKFSNGLIRHEVSIPISWAAEETLLFAAILIVISHVFRRGIELQEEQKLTI
jgi:hypothetical protein